MTQLVTIEEARRRERPQLSGMIDPISLQGRPVPVRQWAVDDLIPLGQTTLLTGNGGLGKTLLALQLACAAALGHDWLGKRVRPVKVLAFCCEDDQDELHRRLQQILHSSDAEFGDLENFLLFSRVGEDNALWHYDSQGRPRPSDVWNLLTCKISDFGAQLIILDSIHDLFGGNENFRNQSRHFIGQLTKIAHQINGAVLLLGHPSMAGLNTGSGVSGSTAWHNAVRARLYLTHGEEDDRDSRLLKIMKSNYGPTGAKIKLHWQEGTFKVDSADTGIVKSINQRRAQKIFLCCLAKLEQQDRTVCDAPQSPTRYAPKVMAAMPEAEGLKEKALKAAMLPLFTTGFIEIATVQGNDRHKVMAIRATKSGLRELAGTAGASNDE